MHQRLSIGDMSAPMKNKYLFLNKPWKGVQNICSFIRIVEFWMFCFCFF